MNFSQLRAFHAVAAHGTFSSAAAQLGISQSAVTQHVRALEDLLGARLFHRRSGGVVLTEDATDLLPKVKQVMLSLEDIGSRLDEGRDLRTGYLALGLCSPHVAMPIVQRFRAALPGIQIEMRLENSSTLLDLVEQHRIDVAIVTLREPRPNLLCELLTRQELLVLVPSDHAWMSRSSVALQELEGQCFVTREPGSMTRRLFEDALAKAGVQTGECLEIGSREAMKEAVAAGLGLGIVLDRELGADTRLKGLKLCGGAVIAGEYLVTQPALSALGAVRNFVTCARDCYPSSPVTARS